MTPTNDKPTSRGHWPGRPILLRATFLCILLMASGPLRSAEQPVTLVLEAEDFHYQGDWSVAADKSGHSGEGFLFAGPSGAALPAATAIELPRAGRYQLWVRSLDFPTYRPGTRLLTVSVHGQRSKEVFGDSGKEGWTWEPGGAFDLPAGKILLSIHDVSKAGRGGLTVRVRSVGLNFKHRRRVAVGNQDGLIGYVLETTCFLERLAEI